VIQIQVRPFSVFSTNKVDSGSNAEVGSMMRYQLSVFFCYIYYTILPSSKRISGFKASATARAALCISPPDK
jgi:hypothetical protein